jgi:hypothetical protein
MPEKAPGALGPRVCIDAPQGDGYFLECSRGIQSCLVDLESLVYRGLVQDEHALAKSGHTRVFGAGHAL